jgi:hypothetical protein
MKKREILAKEAISNTTTKFEKFLTNNFKSSSFENVRSAHFCVAFFSKPARRVMN